MCIIQVCKVRLFYLQRVIQSRCKHRELARLIKVLQNGHFTYVNIQHKVCLPCTSGRAYGWFSKFTSLFANFPQFQFLTQFITNNNKLWSFANKNGSILDDSISFAVMGYQTIFGIHKWMNLFRATSTF